MEIDWAQAAKIGGVGFGLVFVVLLVLSVAIWLTGTLVSRFTAKEEPAGEKKKGA